MRCAYVCMEKIGKVCVEEDMITWCRHANNFISMGRLGESEGGVEHMKKDSINLFPTRRSTLLCFSYDAYFMDGQANSTRPRRSFALLFNCLIEREHHYHQIGFRTRYLTLCALASSLLTNWIKTAVHVNFVKINILCRYLFNILFLKNVTEKCSNM